jgi:hypothetical protein
MLRFITKFLLLAIILVGGGMYAAHWKLQKEVKDFSDQVRPFMDFDYQSTSVGMDGEMRIRGISIFVQHIGAHIEIGEMKFFAGNLFELMRLESKLQERQLPEKAYISFDDVLLPFDSKLMVEMDKQIKPTSLDVLNTAYCGNIARFGLDEYEKMGYSYLSFSTDLHYLLDQYSGNLVITGSTDIEEMNYSEFQINISGVLSWLEELDQISLFGGEGGFITPDLSLVEMRIQDKGYNLRKAEYCDKQQQGETNYYSGHIDAVKSLLQEVQVELPEALSQGYYQAIQPDSQVNILVKPKVTFDFKNVPNYDYAQLIDAAGVQVTVNNQDIPLAIEGASFTQFERLLQYAKDKEDAAARPKDRYKMVTIPQSFQQVATSSIGQYKDYRARITRDDNQVYEGKLARFSNDRIWIVVRGKTGEVTIPVRRNRLKLVEIYKPTPKNN